MTLSPKQERFVAEYLVDLNATQAAVRAGYSKRTASEQGSRLLGNVRVSEAVAIGKTKYAEDSGITAKAIINELAKLGFSNMLDYMRVGPDGDPVLDFSQLTREQAAALAEVTVEDFLDGRGADARKVRKVKFKLCDKRAALVDLGKHLGLFKEQVEHTGKGGGPIQTEDVTEPPSVNELARRVAHILALAARERITRERA